MKFAGRMITLALALLVCAGGALGQDDAAPTDTGKVEKEVGETSSAPTVRRQHMPFGVRAGYTNWKSISQAHAGVHAYAGELWPNVEFTPNIEVGFGDDVFIMTINGDLTYLFTEFFQHPWELYGGGSLSFNLVNPSIGDTETDLGLSGLVGTRYNFANDHKGMVEIRFGIMDSPHFKLTFGYTLF